MISVDVTRDQIVSQAREWIGTPYHHQARVRGAGVDCIGLLICVCRELGLVAPDFDVNGYAREATTSVQTLALRHLDAPQRASFEVHAEPTDAWKGAFCRMNGVEGRHLPAMEGILRNIVSTAFWDAMLRGHGRRARPSRAAGRLRRDLRHRYDSASARAWLGPGPRPAPPLLGSGARGEALVPTGNAE